MEGNALIVIDMLVDFIDKNGALYCGPTAEKMVPFIKKEIERTRENGGLIIYLTDAHKPNDKEFQLFPKHCVKGTPGAQVIPELKPKRGDVVIPKTRFSGFYGTKLGEILKANKVQHVTVVGVCTSICVMDTVGRLRDRDYPVTVPKEGVADFDKKFHKFALVRMQKTYGAKVV